MEASYMLQLTFLPVLDISMLKNFSPWLDLYTNFRAPFHDSLLSRCECLLLLTPAMPFPDKCYSFAPIHAPCGR
jgi:hypothetical protein